VLTRHSDLPYRAPRSLNTEESRCRRRRSDARRCGDEKRPRRSSDYFIAVAFQRGIGATRPAGGVCRSVGRTCDGHARSSLAFDLGQQSDIDCQVARASPLLPLAPGWAGPSLSDGVCGARCAWLRDLVDQLGGGRILAGNFFVSALFFDYYLRDVPSTSLSLSSLKRELFCRSVFFSSVIAIVVVFVCCVHTTVWQRRIDSTGRRALGTELT